MYLVKEFVFPQCKITLKKHSHIPKQYIYITNTSSLIEPVFGCPCVLVHIWKRKKICFLGSTSLHRTHTGVNTLLTLHSEVDLLCLYPSFVYSDTLVPAWLVWGHRGHLKRKVTQDVDSWVQTGVMTSSQPGEVEVDRADDMAGEDSMRARRCSYVSLNCDGWRRLCRMKAQCFWLLPGNLHYEVRVH